MPENTNLMRAIRIEKITLNIGAGGPGDKLEKALKLIKKVTDMTPVKTKTKKRIPTWGIRPNLEIGAKVTVRGKKAEDILKRLLVAKKNKLAKRKFDKFGNLSFGVEEYISIPGVEYDASIGIIGFECAVSLRRNGFRIARRRVMPRPISHRHRISQEESIQFMKQKYNIAVEE
ncbi:MAG TPA: 50S ribosomal protein L5 [Candidatus Nanoarchaeia archaeon]|nr:50S ribosomal protein L5 [Candidatus Nanoarchaeia archaeon]